MVSNVPEMCTTHLELRTIPFLRSTRIQREIRKLARTMKCEDPEFKVNLSRLSADEPPVFISQDERIVEAAKIVIAELLPGTVRVGTSAGWTMAGWLTQTGVPSIVLGPGSLLQAHSANEWVRVNDIRWAARVYTRIPLQVLT